MALTTKIIDADLLMLRIGFADGVTATLTAGRDGRSVSMTPTDPETAERLSSIFHWSADKVGEPGYPFTSLSQVIYGMETLARSALNVEQFIAGLREVLEVSDRHPVHEVGIRAPSFTVVDLSPSGNGWFVDARFQNGERFRLAINKASLRMGCGAAGACPRQRCHGSPLWLERRPEVDGRGPCADGNGGGAILIRHSRVACGPAFCFNINGLRL